MRCVPAAMLSALMMLSNAAAADGWQIWHRELKLWCPTHHVERICEDCYIDLIEDFDRTLAKRVRSKVTAIADTSHRCAHDVAGFSFEMAAHLEAMNRLGLMTRFAQFGCRHYRCSEPSMCTSP